MGDMKDIKNEIFKCFDWIGDNPAIKLSITNYREGNSRRWRIGNVVSLGELQIIFWHEVGGDTANPCLNNFVYRGDPEDEVIQKVSSMIKIIEENFQPNPHDSLWVRRWEKTLPQLKLLLKFSK